MMIKENIKKGFNKGDVTTKGYTMISLLPTKKTNFRKDYGCDFGCTSCTSSCTGCISCTSYTSY
jgi:hypothetical protein